MSDYRLFFIKGNGRSFNCKLIGNDHVPLIDVKNKNIKDLKSIIEAMMSKL